MSGLKNISKLLALVYHRTNKYTAKVKSVLTPANATILTDTIAAADEMIREITNAKTFENTKNAYDKIEDILPLFSQAAEIVGDFTIVSRWGVGMTTADETEMQNIANLALAALQDYVNLDVREYILEDSRQFADADVIRAVANANHIGLYLATLIADRGIGAHVSQQLLKDAKIRALGFSKDDAPTRRAPQFIVAIPPLTPYTDLQSCIASLTSPVIKIWRTCGGTTRSNYDVLLVDGKFPQYGGLTRAVLKKYETIIDGEPRTGETGETHDTQKTASATDMSCIIETTDGVMWAAWNGGNPVHNDIFAAHDIPIAYHDIMSPTILSRMFDPAASAVAQKYATMGTEFSGSTVLDAAKAAILADKQASIAAMGDRPTRAGYMKIILDRAATVQTALRAYPQYESSSGASRPSLRESIAREGAASKFAKLIERQAHIASPTEKEFNGSYEIVKRIMEVALQTTIDAAYAEAKRTKAFASGGRNIAEILNQS